MSKTRPERYTVATPALILVIVWAGLAGIPSWAATGQPASNTTDPAQVEQALQASRARAAALSAEQDQLNRELAQIRETLATNALLLQAREKERRELVDRIGDLEARLGLAQARLNERRDEITRVVAGLQRVSRVPPETLLTRARTVPELARAAILLRAAIPALKEQLAPLTAEVEAVRQLKDSIEHRRLELASLSAELGKQDSQLEALLAERAERLRTTAADRTRETERVAALAKQAADLQSLMRDLQKLPEPPTDTAVAGAPRPRHRLQLLFPVAGKITSPYHAPMEGGGRREGIVLAARVNQAVLAPAAGTVRYAGPFRRYGQLIIVQHNEEYHSVVAGPLRPMVEVGQSVNAGEPLARLDPAIEASNSLPSHPVSGSNAGDLPVYFEIRHKGRPINPAPLLADTTTQD